jgi:hypothetical protein
MQLLCKTNSLPISSIDFPFCIDFNKSKAHKLPFVHSTSVATAPLQVIHTDLWGPAPKLSFSGHRYYVHFTNEFTRFSWLYTCTCKSDVVPIFHQFKQKVENLLSCTIKVLQCDGGTEFLPLQSLYHSITFRLSCPYTPE